MKQEYRGPELTSHKFDLSCMRLAIHLAQKSKDEDGRTHPKVGVVVAKDEKVLDFAYRGETGAGDHAEFSALEKKSLTDGIVSGATVYTTLEPCTTRNHPKIPCVERLIERRISRVVYGMVDPDPTVSGKGILRLQKAKIAMETFSPELTEEILDLNRHFIRDREQKKSQKFLSPPDEFDYSVDLLGAWCGSWSNPKSKSSGEEVIHFLKCKGNTIMGSFFDKEDPQAPIVFEGTFRNPYLRVQYYAPYRKSEGKSVMEDGSCFLELQADGIFKGFYAGFKNFGEYELRRL